MDDSWEENDDDDPRWRRKRRGRGGLDERKKREGERGCCDCHVESPYLGFPFFPFFFFLFSDGVRMTLFPFIKGLKSPFCPL